MIVTDLHGDGPAFDRICDSFLHGHANGTIDHLLICGDLIHKPDPFDPTDDSLRMINELARLHAELGPSTVTYLCGNHEMPHIYGQPLLRGDTNVTAPFEHAMSQANQRQEIVNFLADLPFFAYTSAGVLFTHAGPTHEIATPGAVEPLLNFDHHALIDHIDAQLVQYDLPHARTIYATQYGENYAVLAEHLLGATHESDPHYDHLLRGFFLGDDEAYQQLWQLLFSRCEQILPNDLRRVTVYESIVQNYLNAISTHLPEPQHIIVSGHIATRGGHEVIDDYHFRLSTHAHAKPQAAGQYLLIDTNGTYRDADDLVDNLRFVRS
ncbi:MAG: metallophosphoesterase [Chloroflexota bacterium]